MATLSVPSLTDYYAGLTGPYAFDPTHSRIGFVARHAMVAKVRGQFSEFSGEFYLDGSDISHSRAKVIIEADSIDTGNAMRDDHLRSNDFLAMESYPQIVFESTAIEQVDERDFRVTGDLTIRGITNSISLDLEHTGVATDPYGVSRVAFEGSTTVNRSDWGVNWNAALEAGGVLVGDKVTLEFEITLVEA